MKRFWCLVLVGYSAGAGALKKKFCEHALLVPVEHVVRRLDFSPLGGKRLAPTTREDIAGFAAQRGMSVLTDARGRAYGMTFDTRIGRRDRGFLLRGDLDGDVLRVRNVRVSAQPEKRFFARVAEARGIGPLIVPLAREILDCASLVLAGWTQVKLTMKHRLTMEEVARLLGRLTAPAVRDSQQGDRLRYVIDDVDDRGKPFRLVVEEADCPHGLITAFERIAPR